MSSPRVLIPMRGSVGRYVQIQVAEHPPAASQRCSEGAVDEGEAADS
jgi:hypothetical protein